MCEFPIEMRKKFDHRKWKLNENINQIWLNGFGMLFTNESTAEMFVYAFFHCMASGFIHYGVSYRIKAFKPKI